MPAAWHATTAKLPARKLAQIRSWISGVSFDGRPGVRLGIAVSVAQVWLPMIAHGGTGGLSPAVHRWG
jgi:hypothetical protein